MKGNIIYKGKTELVSINRDHGFAFIRMKDDCLEGCKDWMFDTDGFSTRRIFETIMYRTRYDSIDFIMVDDGKYNLVVDRDKYVIQSRHIPKDRVYQCKPIDIRKYYIDHYNHIVAELHSSANVIIRPFASLHLHDHDVKPITLIDYKGMQLVVNNYGDIVPAKVIKFN